ncbi:MAG: methyltransferase domain-containing protein [Acidobacteriota bacterium]
MVEPTADLERARLSADRQYNDALSTLDRAVVEISRQEALGRDDLARVTTALIIFLQQITAFVETKDRELEARLTDRVEALAPTIASVAELRTQMTVLQRTTQLVTHALASAAPPDLTPSPTPARSTDAPSRTSLDDVAYVGFEDEFRGSEANIEARLRDYLPLFAAAGAATVVDLGCGRGEFLRLLGAQGIAARGVDLNDEMIAAARAHGLDAVQGDALAFLTSIPEESLGGLIATQMIEHLEPTYLMRVLQAARRALGPGAPIVVETINPACWLAFFSSYIRDLTHVRPVHPETLQYLLRANGFERVSIRYSAPVPEQVKMKAVNLPAEVTSSPQAAAQALVETARVLNGNAAILNSLLFTYQDYAAVGYRV